MKYRLKKKMLLLLVASMATSQLNFVFADVKTNTDGKSIISNNLKGNSTTTSEPYKYSNNILRGGV